MKKYCKILILAISLIAINNFCIGMDLNFSVPANFPRQKASPKQITTSAFVKAFYDKWAMELGNNAIIKTYDNVFTGISWKEEITTDVFPEITILNPSNKNFISCKLYNGAFNNIAYKKLKTPLLYDEEHNICVAAVAVRDYTQTNNPYFEEPKEMQNYVSISGYFPNIPQGNIKLKELAIIPPNSDDKEIDKYVKQIMKTYTNFLRAEELGVPYNKVPSKASENFTNGVNGFFEILVKVIYGLAH